MRRWLIRIVVVLAMVEVAYLVAANVVLNLASTQDYINRIHPEKYTYSWDQAWSWHPFRLHATEFTGSFQTWSQQWQVTAPEVSASIAYLPLLWKSLHFYDMEGANIDLRFRPRPSPDRNDAALRQYYPTIEGRDPNLAAGEIPTESPGWKFVFDISSVSGKNDVWVWAAKATLDGEASGTIIHQSRHGPLTISDGEIDATVTTLTIDGQPVSHDGSVKGTVDMATFIPYENRGLKMLNFLSVDGEIDLPIDGLSFLDDYLDAGTGLTVRGKGGLKGRIVYDKGSAEPGTDLTISADGLKASATDYSIDGAGKVDVTVSSDAPKTLDAKFGFDTLSAHYKSDENALFTGKDIDVTIERSTRVLPGGDDAKGPSLVSLNMPMVSVANLKTYQAFLPDKWQVELLGGTGSLEGQVEMSAAALTADLTLQSKGSSIKFKDDSFETDLDLVIKASGKASDETAQIDVSGSYLNLDDSAVKTPKGADIDNWQARLSVSTGEADFALPKTDEKTFGGFWKLTRDKDIKSLLTTVDGQFKAGLTISDLDWANDLLNNPYSLAFRESAKIDADLTLSSGFLDKGSTLKMQPQDFKLEVLDYVAAGSGGFDLTVEKGGEQPDLRFDANLANASLRQQDEKQAVVDEMTLTLTANAKNVGLKNGGDVTTVDLSIPSAKVTDMTAYNAYMPKGSPLRILGGTADLTAKVDLQPDTAGGFVKLNTSRVEANLDGTRMSGTVALDAKINGGSAKDKMFDITGSSLKIDGVRVDGGGSTGWNARMDFGKSSVVWKRPIKLNASTSIRMTDTRPLVEIFQAHRKSHKWLDRILTLKDVRGNATIKVEPNEFVVPYALAKSDTVEVGAKGFISEGSRQGMFYAKYGALAGILEFDNGKKHFSIFQPTKKFKEYVPGGKLPGMRTTHRSPRSREWKYPLSSLFKKRR